MKKILLALMFCIPILSIAQTETLTNADIVKLTKLDLPSTAIISKIKNSKTHFDVGIDALVALKKQGVSADVISEMINSGSSEQQAIANQKDLSDPKTMRAAGIYYYSKSSPNSLFTQIDPTVVSSSKSGGFGTALAQRYTAGLVKNKEKSSLSGANSRRQIKHTKPKFYFYFNGQTNQMASELWWFNSASSPNEFALVKLTENRDNREMVVATSNAYGHSIGIDEKQKIDFDYEQVSDGIYKVSPKNSLEVGEYCFIYTGSVPTTYSNNKVFDFGISAE
jgi:hypothetical protein